MVRVLFGLVVAASLAACNLLQSKEEQCLQSARLQMKDPDSAKVVQSLGDRGHGITRSSSGFWIRYSATNSYGARVSKNMACVKTESSWVRSEAIENDAILLASYKFNKASLDALNLKVQSEIDAQKACKTASCRLSVGSAIKSYDTDGSIARAALEADAFSDAKRLVLDETNPLNDL